MTKIGNFKVDVQYLYNKQGKEVTTAHIYNRDNVLLTRGSITRNPKDTPSKKIAFKKVIKEAFTNSDVPKRLRSEFWESFRIMTKKPRWETKENYVKKTERAGTTASIIAKYNQTRINQDTV